MSSSLNWKQLIFLLIPVFLLLGVSCKSRQETILGFETKDFEKNYRGCVPEKEVCAYVKINYPEFTSGAKPQVLKKINKEVREIVIKPVPAGKPQTPESYTEDLFAEYEKFKKEFPNLPLGWEMERNVKVEQPSFKILTLVFSEYSFLGGAHPNTFVKFMNFNTQTGDLYRLGDLFRTGFEGPLNEAGEKIFRETYRVSPDQNLEDAGFFFNNGEFRLNENFLITPAGLTFLFNPYEAAPYATGPLEVVIPYESIQGILKPEGPLPPKR